MKDVFLMLLNDIILQRGECSKCVTLCMSNPIKGTLKRPNSTPHVFKGQTRLED